MDNKQTGSSSDRGKGTQHRPNNFSRGKGDSNTGNHKGKKRDMGRSAWSKQKGDKRKQHDNAQAAKRQKLANGEEQDLPVYATKFSEEDLKAEERRPKKKVAVMIGYSGTGYKGMQLAHDQKTIEGDLFQAFVAAGAISKANADDPKKSSFVRCARTDKGVHAAGNVVSLKLIVEDEDIVQKVNQHLNPQIRIWGYERTSNSFSAYQMVDSRIYEYLIPTHSFLPPHPRSHLGRKCVEWAEKKGETEAWKERQKEVEGYWEKVDEEVIIPILEEYDAEIRSVLEKALWLKSDDNTTTEDEEEDESNSAKNPTEPQPPTDSAIPVSVEDNSEEAIAQRRERMHTINEAVKRLRYAYVVAKRAYRMPTIRLDRLRTALAEYTGTRNYHNYTIQKSHRDPSAKRVIKSFLPADTPILINGTEWLSLKVHGQSFMMHQIRKMVGMACLAIRCGADPTKIIPTSYGPDNISIPKAPSLGLLLERPIFENYNRRATKELNLQDINFDKYKAEMDDFKQTQIYDRMWADEEKENTFGNFFNHIDNFPAGTFLFVTSGGVEATREDDTNKGTGQTHLKNGKAMMSGQISAGSKGDDELAPTTLGTSHKDADSDSDADDFKDDAAGNEG